MFKIEYIQKTFVSTILVFLIEITKLHLLFDLLDVSGNEGLK